MDITQNLIDHLQSELEFFREDKDINAEAFRRICLVYISTIQHVRSLEVIL